MGNPEPIEADPAFPFLAQAAANLGVRAWAVGGYVRDRLLGRHHREIDVVVEDGRGPELAANFAQLTGSPPPVVFERFGTAQVIWGERPGKSRAHHDAIEAFRVAVAPGELFPL